MEKNKIEKVISEKVIKQHIDETRKVWQRQLDKAEQGTQMDVQFVHREIQC